MRDHRPPRRRAPLWLREFSPKALHALAGSLQKQSETDDLSDRQEWLWEACVSELEYRHRRDLRRGRLPCVCQFCLPPFEQA